MNWIISTILGVALVATNIFPSYDSWLSRFVDNFKFGAISYPTSLDSLTNPSGTDSVATVSHSAQHSNANDAIEALQAKLGISASTAITNSIFAGNGSGSSIWTTHATATQFYATNLFATGSSTLQNYTFINATGTSATTTNIFSITASTTNQYGANLTNCNGSNYLQWASGKFGCGLPVSAGTTINHIAATSTPLAASAFPRPATTTSILNGQKLMIWASCSANASSRIGLYVKPAGSATTTLSGALGTDSEQITLFGIYTSTADENIEIYWGDDPLGGAYNYINCFYPSFMYQRFDQ